MNPDGSVQSSLAQYFPLPAVPSDSEPGDVSVGTQSPPPASAACILDEAILAGDRVFKASSLVFTAAPVFIRKSAALRPRPRSPRPPGPPAPPVLFRAGGRGGGVQGPRGRPWTVTLSQHSKPCLQINAGRLSEEPALLFKNYYCFVFTNNYKPRNLTKIAFYVHSILGKFIFFCHSQLLNLKELPFPM
jgi:hypothetical protein